MTLSSSLAFVHSTTISNPLGERSLCFTVERYLRGGVTEGLRRDGEGVGVYSRVERRGGVLLLSNKDARMSITEHRHLMPRNTHSSRGIFRSSSTLLLFVESGPDLRSSDGARLYLGGVADREADRDLLLERFRRTGLPAAAGGVADPSLATGRREGGVVLASDRLRRRGGVREGDRDLERSLEGDLPLRFSVGRSSSSKYRPRLGITSDFLLSSR